MPKNGKPSKGLFVFNSFQNPSQPPHPQPAASANLLDGNTLILLKTGQLCLLFYYFLAANMEPENSTWFQGRLKIKVEYLESFFDPKKFEKTELF